MEVSLYSSHEDLKMDISKYDDIWLLLSEYSFDIDFDSTNDDLKCNICYRLMSDACHSVCGCHYCFKCISEYLTGGEKYCIGGNTKCTDEYMNLERDVMRDIRVNNKICGIIVPCPNECCDITVELRDMREHLRVCTKKSFECPFSSIGCVNKIKVKKSIQTHLHDDVMPHTQLLIDWIHNLKNEVNDLKDSLAMSKLEICSIKKQSINTEVQLKESILALASEHKILLDEMFKQKNEIMEEMMIQKKELSNEMKEQRKEILDIVEQNKNEIKEEMMTHKNELSNEMKEERKTILETVERSKKDSVKRDVVENLSKQVQEIYENLMGVAKQIKEKTEEEVKKQRIEILKEISERNAKIEQLEDEYNNRKIEIESLGKSFLEIKEEMRNSLSSMSKRTEKSQIEIEITGKEMNIDNVQIPSQELFEVIKCKSEHFEDPISKIINNLIKLCPSVDVDFIWKIEDCSKKIAQMKGKRVFSEPFYSNNYKFCLYMFINNTGNNIGVYCLIMRGDYDDNVKWPMRLAMTISLIDQDTLRIHKCVTHQYDSYSYNKSVFDKPTNDRNNHGICASPIIDYGYIKASPSLMVDDSIVVTCTVKQ